MNRTDSWQDPVLGLEIILNCNRYLYILEAMYDT
jgi:hypothetical protein